MRNTRSALLFGAMALLWPVVSVAADKPNLLIIMTDEHNFRTLGCYRDLMPKAQALMWGDAVVETPNIDWIARQGAICTSFYASTPVCSPARSSFVSGRYPQHTPVTTNNIPLDDDIKTFAHVLSEQGYATGYAGKWHLDGPGKPQWEPKRKFGFADNRFMFNRGHWKKLIMMAGGPRVGARDKKGNPTYAVNDADELSFATDFLTDRTLDFIREHADEPFCYMVSFPDPHGPDTVRKPYDTMYEHMTFTQPRNAKPPDGYYPAWAPKENTNFNMSKYYGMVKCIDDNVGRMVALLRQKKILNKTIVVFTSDHGDLRGEHSRHNKGNPYEGSARVPFVICYQGKIAAGTRVDKALTTVDFQPTILALMNSKLSGEEEGRNAASLFLKEEIEWKDIAFMRSTSKGADLNAGWLAAVSDRYKLVYSHVEKPYLFDLQEDADELDNAIDTAAGRAIAREMTRAMLKYADQYNDLYVTHPKVKADIQWVLDGGGDYHLPPSGKTRGKKAKQ